MNAELRTICAAILLLVLTGTTLATQLAGHERLTPAEIKAIPSTGASVGTSGVSGIETRVLAGDPTKAGPYTIALSVPPDTQIQAHTHRDYRSVVVVSGTWHFGYGNKAERSLEEALGPGSFYLEPPAVAHFARTGTEPVIVYISGYGPTDTHYVDQQMDPRSR